MDEVNISTPPPSESGPPPPPSRWPLYILVVILAILVAFVVGGLAATALHRAAQRGAPTATPTSTPATSAALGGSTATVTPATHSGATPTAAHSGGVTTATATPAAGVVAAQLPANPTVLRVADGSCALHRITWTWTGARRASAYDVVLYNPVTQAEVRAAQTHIPSYTLGAQPGTTVALKVRSRNNAGAAPTYATPGATGRVPPHTSNPTRMTVVTRGHTITWLWSGARHATVYDVVLYHYHGKTAEHDIVARTAHTHWGTAVTPGITYFLKVRAVGPCAAPTYYTPAQSARAGT